MAENALLIQMVEKKSLEGVKALIAAGVDLNVQNDKGQTALILATQGGSVEMLTSLIQAGADLNKQDKFGLTGLMCACKLGNAALAKIWIEAGADISLKDAHGYTALALAKMYHQDAIVKMLQDQEAKLAASQPGTNATQPGPETQPAPGEEKPLTMQEKLLIAACVNGENQTVQKLLESGTNPNLKVQEIPLLWMMLVRKNEELAKALIKAGANVNEPYKGIFPLMVAIKEKMDAVIPLLLEAKVDLQAKDPNGNTAVIYAIFDQNWELACRLVEAGADPNTHIKGNSLLILALISKNPQAALRLIKAGADVNVANADGLTPMLLAKESNYTEVMNALQAPGAQS